MSQIICESEGGIFLDFILIILLCQIRFSCLPVTNGCNNNAVITTILLNRFFLSINPYSVQKVVKQFDYVQSNVVIDQIQIKFYPCFEAFAGCSK